MQSIYTDNLLHRRRESHNLVDDTLIVAEHDRKLNNEEICRQEGDRNTFQLLKCNEWGEVGAAGLLNL